MHDSILVTGGAGFIGSHFVRALLRTFPDRHVLVLDQLTYAGTLENLRDLSSDPRLSFLQGNICDPALVAQAMQPCSWVIHFAAETHVDRSIRDALPFVQTDVQGTVVLLEAARRLPISRFLQVSTDEVYGSAAAPDGSSRPSVETDPLRPLSPYAASKAGADRLAFAYWATYGVPVVITRCSNNYGPAQYPEKQLPLFILSALAGRPLPVYGDGHHTRDWIHVSDHVAALLSLLLAPSEQVVGEVFNIGSGVERSSLDNARLILDLLHLPPDRLAFVPDRLAHVPRHAVDASKLRQRLGWSPAIPFDSGLRDTIDWFRAHASRLLPLLPPPPLSP